VRQLLLPEHASHVVATCCCCHFHIARQLIFPCMNTFWLSPLSTFLPGQSVQTYEKVRDRLAAVEYTGGWACMLKPKDRRRTAALSQSMSMRFLSIYEPSRLVLGAGTLNTCLSPGSLLTSPPCSSPSCCMILLCVKSQAP